MRFLRNTTVKVFIVVFLLQLSSQALADVSLKGTVKDQNGKLLEGVTVQIKGTDLAAITNSKGEYKLEVPDNAILIYSFIGLKTVEKKVSDGMSTLNITLEDDFQQLSELIVFGFIF